MRLTSPNPALPTDDPTVYRPITARARLTIDPARAALVTLIAFTVLAAALRFINLEAVGDGNLYYTAAVEAMLQSPSNFFFAAAEPGGSVTVDKPPVGLWLQAISAAVFGVNGAAVVLPQILASIACVPLLYLLVRRQFGMGAGLVAAFVMAVMPIDIAAARNNTMDMTLVLTLLLAAFAYLRATETGRLRWLMLGGVLVGIGFNIKMMQALLPVPAFFALYLLGARVGWGRKLAQLAASAVVLAVVSLSWALVVDAIPAENRPYVGSSATNSVVELMLGYNGINRLTGGQAPGGGAPNDGNVLAGGGAAPPGGGTLFGNETGSPGPLRLFAGELGAEAGWLLPAALLALLAVMLSARPRLPIALRHQGAVLWGGWLLTVVVFFSMAEFFHAYYLVMLTPAAAALVGAGIGVIAQARLTRPRLAGLLAVGTAFGVAAYHIALANSYLGEQAAAWLPILILPIGLAGAALALLILPMRGRGAGAAIALAAGALLVVPTAWGAATTLDAADSVLPHAWNGGADAGAFPGGGPDGGARPAEGALMIGGGSVDAELLAYVQANTEGMRYMMAVGSSMIGAPYVIETGRGVLYMGGFSGGDPVVDAADLQALVSAGDLRYVLSGGMGGPMGMPGAQASDDNGITTWLDSACVAVEGYGLAMDGITSPMIIGGGASQPLPPAQNGGLPTAPGQGGPGRMQGFPISQTLYDCAAGA